MSARFACRSSTISEFLPRNPPRAGLSRPAVHSRLMNTARIDATLATMTAEEIGNGLWIVDVCERCGTMREADADEWRRRIEARREFLEVTCQTRD